MGAWYLSYLIFGEEIKPEEEKETAGDETFHCFGDSGYTYLKRGNIEFLQYREGHFHIVTPTRAALQLT